MKKTSTHALISIAFVAIFALIHSSDSFADASSVADKELVLSLEDVSRLAVTESLGIHILEYSYLSQAEEPVKSRAIYDTVLTADETYKYDETPSLSIFGASVTEGTKLNAGVKKLLPTGTEVGFTASGERQKANSTFVTQDPSFTTSGTLTLKQNVLKNFLGASDSIGIKKIEIDTERFNYETLSNIESTMFDIRSQYWKVLEAGQALVNEKKALEDANELHEISKDKLKLGLLEQPDYYASLSNVKKKEIAVLIGENRVIDRENELKVLLSIPLKAVIIFKETPWVAEPNYDLNDVMKQAMSERFDRKSALLELEKQGLEVRMRWFELWPRVDVEASLTTNGLGGALRKSIRQASQMDYPTYTVGFSAEYPLENRAALSQYRQARFDKERAILALDQTEKVIEKEVDEAFRELELSYERYERRKKIEELEKQKLDEETARFEMGRSSSDLVIEYQNQLLIAGIARIQAYVNLRISEDALKKASSQLLKPYYKKEIAT